MRYRVDFKNGAGYASYDESDYMKALEMYAERGVRLRRCRDIHDEGIVIMGEPLVEDLTSTPWNDN